MKKKICFIVSSPYTAKVFLTNHIVVLSEIYDIYIIANFDNEKECKFDDLEIKQLKNIAISRKIDVAQDLKALFQMKNYFKTMQFDAVHSVTPKAGLLGITAARLAGIKVRIHIFTGQVWHTKSGLFKKFLMFLDKIIVFNATNILVDGQTQRKFLISNKIIKEANSEVLGKGSISGVDVSRFVPDENKMINIRQQLGYNPHVLVFMFLGRMNRDKGVIELATAFNKLQLKYSNVKLLFVGGDEENMVPIVQEIVTEKKSLLFYGSTPTPELLLQACDVFCLPSHREGFGTSVIEASLLNKPVICSDTYGLMETIVDEVTGLRHKVNDVESLFTQMEKLVLNNELRNQLGANGRDYVIKNFSAQIISQNWLMFYKTYV